MEVRPLLLSRELEIVAEPDVLVCGAGCAGVGAAIAAAESGLRVMVVDSAGFAGGFITAVMGPGLDGMFDVATGEIVVGGIALDMLDRVCGIPRSMHNGRFTYGGDITAESGVDPGKSIDPAAAGLTPVEMNLEAFKHYADSRFQELGIDVLYHTQACDVRVTGDRVDAVVLANKAGLTAVRPKLVIDCTGDADVAAWAGNPVDVSAQPQPMTLHFRLGGVALTDTLVAHCSQALKEAASEGLIPRYGGPYMLRMGPQDVAVNTTRIRADRTDPVQWTRAEIEGRDAAWRIFHLWRERVPECADAYYITSGPEAGARETRRVVGSYTLTADDIAARRRFPDAIVQGAWYFDRHVADASGFHQHGKVRPYDIPYGTLVPQRTANVLVAGRCHSATSEALASSRVTATALGMGEAAGVAVALVNDSRGASVAEAVKLGLRQALIDRGAILE